MTDVIPKTEFEKYFVSALELLDDIGVPYFIHGGTLLGWMRNGRILERHNSWLDHEVNFGMLAEDYTRDFHDKLNLRSKFFETHAMNMANLFPKKFTFFSSYEIPKGKDQWSLPGFSLITLFWRGKTKIIEFMGDDIALNWPLKHLEDKSTWETIEYYGHKVKTPYQKEKFLERYYGADYMKEKTDWWFRNDAKNIRFLSQLLSDGEINFKHYKLKDRE